MVTRRRHRGSATAPSLASGRRPPPPAPPRPRRCDHPPPRRMVQRFMTYLRVESAVSDERRVPAGSRSADCVGCDLPVMPPLSPDAGQGRRQLARRATAGCTSRSGTASGASCSATATRSSSTAATSARSPATSPSCSRRCRPCLPERCVVDAELVVPGPAGLDFDALQQRIHPAASRVNRLAAETPAHVLAFDLLALGDRDLRDRPAARAARAAAPSSSTAVAVHLSPCTTDRERPAPGSSSSRAPGSTASWPSGSTSAYRPDERTMVKVKHQPHVRLRGGRLPLAQGRPGHRLAAARPVRRRRRRCTTSGCAAASPPRSAASWSTSWRRCAKDALDDHPWREWADVMAHATAAGRMPGSPSRWNAKKDLSWDPVAARAGVRGDVLAADQRSVPPQRPVPALAAATVSVASCRYDQLEVAAPGRAGRGAGGGVRRPDLTGANGPRPFPQAPGGARCAGGACRGGCPSWSCCRSTTTTTSGRSRPPRVGWPIVALAAGLCAALVVVLLTGRPAAAVDVMPSPVPTLPPPTPDLDARGAAPHGPPTT